MWKVRLDISRLYVFQRRKLRKLQIVPFHHSVPSKGADWQATRAIGSGAWHASR